MPVRAGQNNVSSVGGRLTFPGGGHYHATKHAVEAFSDALRFETAGFGIKVVIVEPGLIKTAFGDTATAPAARSEGDPYAAFNDGFKRHVYVSTLRLPNIAGRRQTP